MRKNLTLPAGSLAIVGRGAMLNPYPSTQSASRSNRPGSKVFRPFQLGKKMTPFVT